MEIRKPLGISHDDMIMIVLFTVLKQYQLTQIYREYVKGLQADLHSIQNEQHSNFEVITIKWLEYFIQLCLYFTFKEYIFCILFSIFPTGALMYNKMIL